MRFFITATGTDIGKTYVTCSLIRNLRMQGFRVKALKPVISGYDEKESDLSKLLDALGGGNIEDISLYRLKAPLSPDIAAKREGVQLDFQKILDFCESAKDYDYLFIEGAGGLMTPLTTQHSYLDLIKALNTENILIAGAYLGTISHTLTAANLLPNIKAVILNEANGEYTEFEEVKSSIAKRINAPIFGLRYQQDIMQELIFGAIFNF